MKPNSQIKLSLDLQNHLGEFEITNPKISKIITKLFSDQSSNPLFHLCLISTYNIYIKWPKEQEPDEEDSLELEYTLYRIGLTSKFSEFIDLINYNLMAVGFSSVIFYPSDDLVSPNINLSISSPLVVGDLIVILNKIISNQPDLISKFMEGLKISEE